MNKTKVLFTFKTLFYLPDLHTRLYNSDQLRSASETETIRDYNEKSPLDLKLGIMKIVFLLKV